jgi:hypothetical protein
MKNGVVARKKNDVVKGATQVDVDGAKYDVGDTMVDDEIVSMTFCLR